MSGVGISFFEDTKDRRTNGAVVLARLKGMEPKREMDQDGRLSNHQEV